jgi:hypothetical protein
LLCIQVENSFMGSPWTGTALIYRSVVTLGTGRKCRKRAGGFAGLASGFLAASSGANAVLEE